MRLIDADRLKSYIDCGHLRPPTEVCFSELDVCNMIDKAPTVSAEAVPGEWIRVGHDIYECSLCHQNVMTRDIDCYAYCHRCGARMRKGGDDE